MTISSLLIANRGEIAIRIARAARDLGLRCVTIFSEDDASSLHARACGEGYALPGRGAAAYLDKAAIIRAARETDCDAIHPGYGFLSENVDFASQCETAGLTFVGPNAETLRLLGDKARARELARALGVPLAAGTFGATSLAEVREFVAALPAGQGAMIKAVAGGGGRGIRAVHGVAEIEEAYGRCQSEARNAFGNGDVYVERLIARARHIEVQIIGDGNDVSHVWERDCTLQRRNQKLIEVCPSPGLDRALREKLLDAALRMARHFPYRSLGTFEFLVDADPQAGEPEYFFMEANPRLQVEHTVTEEVTGIDLVQAQLQIAAGRTLAELGLTQAEIPQPRGFAIQVRVNAEQMSRTGEAIPSGGLIENFEPPTGPGVRVDSYAYSGYRTNPAFDSLIAKVIVRSPSDDFSKAVARMRRALEDFAIAGMTTNSSFLLALLGMPEFARNEVYTRFVEDRIADVIGAMEQTAPSDSRPVRLDAIAQIQKPTTLAAPPGTVALTTPLQGVLCSLDVAAGDMVRPGQQIAIMEAMKMEHVVLAEDGGLVRQVLPAIGASLMAGEPLLFVEPMTTGDISEVATAAELDLDRIRPDLAAVIKRHRSGLDIGRPDAVARRRKRNQRTARENIKELCDPGSFSEYGALAVAAQRQRRSIDELIEISPADGMVSGIGTVNAEVFGATRARCMVVAYDFTVFAGTQGWMNHKKKDRMFEIAERWKLPVVIFAEGGGGRPGETDGLSKHGLDNKTFLKLAKLSGAVPLVCIVAGRCFAGNAAIAGTCDVIIATKDSNLGMGGPAMVEGGGLGVYAPEDIGPIGVQSRNGMVDLVAEDETEAVAMARKYLSYFQGATASWRCIDQRRLRFTVPENRRRIYDIRDVIAMMADEDSVLELRRDYGHGMITALIRIEGRPMGVMANNPAHLGGAIDTDAAKKATAFMQLCNSFRLPIVSLCDTPGFMVGPEAEEAGQIRASCGMFLVGSRLRVPFLTVVLRKGYGLGAQSMAAGSFHEPLFTIAWPTGEFGGMGLEGAVRLGYRKELEAIADPIEKQRFFDDQLTRLYEQGEAVAMAAHLEIDAVIDPAETRDWITRAMVTADGVPPDA